MPSLDLNRLRIFREIVVAGSFTRAAANLKQPKSRVSRQLAALEAELGLTLLTRSTRQFQLTPAGRALYAKAVPLLGQLNEALEEVSAGAAEMAGPVRISVPEDLGVELFGGIVDRFAQRHPKVEIELHVGNQVVDLVRDGFDFAVRIGRLQDSGLRQLKLGSANLLPVMSPSLREAAGELRRPEDLARLPYLAFPGLASPRGALRFVGPKGSRLVTLHPALSCNNFFVLRSLAVAGRGFTMLAPFLAREAFAKGELVPALKDWSHEGSQVQAVFPRQGELQPRVRKFLEHVRDELQRVFTA
jgi:DNA-binding transcriptional LysR family regulator